MNRETLIQRNEEVIHYLESWVGVDYLNTLVANLNPMTVSLMILDAASMPLFSTGLGALLCFSVLMDKNRSEVQH